jgi:hypothetical protein
MNNIPHIIDTGASVMNNEQHMIKVFKKIIEGCQNIKEEPDCHEDAKKLASLIIKDCNMALRKAQE